MRSIKAIIFDKDGVLVDSERVRRDCLKKSAKKHQLPFEDEFYERFLGCNHETSLKILIERYKDENIVNELMDNFALYVKEEYENKNVHLKPGCNEILEYVKQNAIPYALATGSSYEGVRDDFLNNGYDSIPFEHIITGDQIKHSKPDPEIFLKAADLMGIDIQDCLIIEDSPKGLEAAIKAGAVTCFIKDLATPDEELLSKVSYKKKDLFEVKELIKGSYGRSIEI